METNFDLARLEALVARVFQIEEYMIGDPKLEYIVRYSGRLTALDSQAAYDYLAGQLAPFGVTPLFRQDGERQAVVLVPGRPTPKPSNPRVNLVMFLLTLASVIFVGWLNSGAPALSANPLQALLVVLRSGLPFAAAILSILGAHEFGHYLAGRYHKVHVTLPYFIPFPISSFGTMGAVINMKEPVKNRRHLLDIGLAGPLAGLVVAIPVVLIGLSLSEVSVIPRDLPRGMSLQIEGNSVLYLFLKFLVFGRLLPAPESYGSLPPLLHWLSVFFTGKPYPLGGIDVMLHPVALAGWGGILVTALNLIPAGQFDGGHILYVLLGRKGAARLLPVILVVLAVLGFFWTGWWLWLGLIFLFGRAHAEPLDEITPLDPRRKLLAALAIVIFFLVFTPAPMSIIGAAGL